MLFSHIDKNVDMVFVNYINDLVENKCRKCITLEHHSELK